ncbi:MAG: inorganic phosphate transporter [Myxococcales bacterium]|nr:inorganic phosphate transporter [Myxococcales bacterium]
MLIALLIVAVLGLAYANGSNDNFKAAATLYGARTLSYRGALTLATAAQIAGSLASVLLAGKLLAAFSGKGLVPVEVVQAPVFLVSVALGGGGTVLLATRVGLPVSTTHALIGGLVGAGLALSPGHVAWNALGAKYFLPLLISPLFALVGTAGLYPLARWLRRRLGVEPTTCLCVEGIVEPVSITDSGALILRRTGTRLTVAQGAACDRSYAGTLVGVSAQRLVDAAHLTSAFALGFARGLNDTPKVLALLVAAGWSGLDPRVSLVIVAAVMAAGGLLHSRRLAETLGHRITSMNHGQGFLANGIASALVIGASLVGSPVSTTHVSTGAIFGIGCWSGSADWRVAGGILLAWVATLPLGALLALGAAKALLMIG